MFPMTEKEATEFTESERKEGGSYPLPCPSLGKNGIETPILSGTRGSGELVVLEERPEEGPPLALRGLLVHSLFLLDIDLMSPVSLGLSEALPGLPGARGATPSAFNTS